jgi:lysophospholipase
MFKIIFLLLIFNLTVFSAGPAQGILENNFAALYLTKVDPFFEKTGIPCQFAGVEKVSIYCRTFINPVARASVVISAGYTEDMHKYAEIAYDLFNQGYSVFLFDHRGQGYSQRLISDLRIASIDEFDNYVFDLHQYVSSIVKKDSTGPIFVLAHSLGGAIAARDLERHPEDFKAAVLSAPMLQINLHGWPEFVAKIWLSIQFLFGRDNDLIDLARDPESILFEENEVTHSRVRYEKHKQILHVEPLLKIYGQTQRWVRKAIDGSRQARQDAALVKVPVLLLQAATDVYVISEGQNEFCQMAQNCRILPIPGSRHEILHETDAVRNVALAEIFHFFSAQAATN